jgi:hypothetical protein
MILVGVGAPAASTTCNAASLGRPAEHAPVDT